MRAGSNAVKMAGALLEGSMAGKPGPLNALATRVKLALKSGWTSPA